MTPQEYLTNRGTIARMARAIGIAPSFLWQISRGDRPLPVQYCVAFEVASDYAVTRRELRPNDWAKIWPELVTKKGVHK